MFGALPKSEVARVLGKQVLRSGTSVGANYREADSARSRAEFIAKMGDSLREISETGYWLELLIESEIVTARKMKPLLDETRELQAVFATIITKARRPAN
jgi:four helix bundle protein